MTTRVVDCKSEPARLVDHARQRPRVRGTWAAACAALVLVPLAGGSQPSDGWPAAVLAATLVLTVAPRLGWRRGYGWLAVAVAALGIVLPRPGVPAIGPALFVAFGLLIVYWVANRRRRWQSDSDPERAREAQLAFGRAGEQEVRGCLVHELPDDYVLINGLTLPRAKGDVDHLVVGPSGVFVLETKMMAGQIVCTKEGQWRRTKIGRRGGIYSAYIGDPVVQVENNISAVRRCLRRQVPRLFASPALWLEGFVVFPHPRAELWVEHSRVPAIHLRDLVQRISTHRPERRLQPRDVLEIVGALTAESQAQPVRTAAQALVELALALPIVLALVFGTVALSRVVQAHSAIVAVAHDVARAGALGATPSDALERMQRRLDAVVPGLGLDRTELELDSDVSGFQRLDGRVVAVVRYAVDLSDLPALSWAPPAVLSAAHEEWIDPFRGGLMTPDEVTD